MSLKRRWTKGGVLAMHASALGQEFECQDYSAGPFTDEGGVAVVRVGGGAPMTPKPELFGTIFGFDNYESIGLRCKAAFESGARAVMLDIASPGGDVTGLFELVDELRALKAAYPSTTLAAFTDSMAASAAYAIATCADKVYVTQTGQLGSIGCISALVDETARDRAQGIRFSVISSGARKMDGNPHVAITEEAENELRSKVELLAGLFFDCVKDSRGISPAASRALDGALLFGSVAVDAGLADGVTTRKKLLADLASPTVEGAMTIKVKAEGEKPADEKKSYEDEMRAKLEEDSKSDDEQKASAAKKMLAALKGEEPAEKPEPEDEKKKKEEAAARARASEDEKQKEEAKASAVALARLGDVERRNAALEAKLEAKDRSEVYAAASAERIKIGGPGAKLSATQIAYLDALPLDKVKAALAAFPAPPADPAAVTMVTPTVGAGNGNDRASRLPPKEAEEMRARMGLTTPKMVIRTEGASRVFPAMTPDEAKAARSAVREGGA